MSIWIKQMGGDYGKLILPVMPEKVTVRSSAQFLTYNIMDLGEVKIPSGEDLLTIAWDGVLPGPKRSRPAYVDPNSEFIDPSDIQGYFSMWRTNKNLLQLHIDSISNEEIKPHLHNHSINEEMAMRSCGETPIHHYVYLSNYSVEYSGAFGDFHYSIEFVAAKDLRVAADSSGAVSSPSGREEPPPPSTYTVKSGDTLWAIAYRFLGDGNRYHEIFELNRDKIKNENLIYVGQVLRLP